MARFAYQSDHWIKVSPLQVVVLLHHICKSEDAENDADYTVPELIGMYDSGKYINHLPRSIVESGLYCCNMENERNQFWHPLGRSFKEFLEEVVPYGYKFDSYYNILSKIEKDK